MAYVITEAYVGVKDGACVEVCPMDCIQPLPGTAEFASADQLFNDPGPCTDCGLCVNECPVGAIFSEYVPDEWRSYIEKNAAHFRAK